MKRALIIFTRIPVQGKTKTRMMPHFSPRQCAALHACFLIDIRKQCEACGGDIFVSYAPESGKLERLKTLLGAEKKYMPQEGEDLGMRMLHAFRQVFEQGYDSCVLVGTDVPELRESHLKKAFWKLQEKDIVFGKTLDGGYYLVGMKKLQPLVFGLNEYGHSRVFQETLDQISESGLTVGFTDTLSDMDTPEDLRGFYRRMRQDSELVASRTGKLVTKIRKISIIIPVYNEAKTIEAMQRQLLPLKDRCEILFVDGGSTDGTRELIRPEYRVISSPKGRACQMNTGAVNSDGDILFFLHCDSELPRNPLGEIRRTLSGHRAGCFGIAFHSKNFFMFTCRVISNHRIKDRKVMFGDQGIFLDRDLFFQAGMFPEIPIMEDYQFSLTLKEMGVKLGMAGHRIYTSDRRFPPGTIPKLKLMWKMNRLRKMYRDGVAIERIAELYRDIR